MRGQALWPGMRKARMQQRYVRLRPDLIGWVLGSCVLSCSGRVFEHDGRCRCNVGYGEDCSAVCLSGASGGIVTILMPKMVQVNAHVRWVGPRTYNIPICHAQKMCEWILR